jgi:prolyl-tRNA editing enzyme YbaK/EbsC (Cys-tRNA(Pro) deacylase)
MGMMLSESAKRVQIVLDEMGVKVEVVELPQSTRTAKEAANAVQCELGQIVKSLVFRGVRTHQPVLLLTSGANRVDEGKVEPWVGEPVKMADATFVRSETGFAIGGVPPIGHIHRLLTLIDEDLLQYKILWAAAGTPHAVFKLSVVDLFRLTKAIAIRVL